MLCLGQQKRKEKKIRLVVAFFHPTRTPFYSKMRKEWGAENYWILYLYTSEIKLKSIEKFSMLLLIVLFLFFLGSHYECVLAKIFILPLNIKFGVSAAVKEESSSFIKISIKIIWMTDIVTNQPRIENKYKDKSKWY